jgi:lipopolysaccharide transport system ATP-binding protein
MQYVDALKGVSFSIFDGERVGIIGRNGSGKSTLLRTLAGVYPLEAGRIRVRGEIGTLLDISLGFELESTGRENIYNRGLAMGYSRKSMQEIEHEIVKFADLGDFIDLPMRTYSSGMFVRLGFAISTQFVPDVLLVDEVFSAGDGVFAKRAIERMNSIVSNAGIVVIVSHDMTAILQMCERIIWIDSGKIKMDGPSHDVATAFAAFIAETAEAFPS